MVRGPFHLVQHRRGVVPERDAALALLVRHELVAAYPVGIGPLAGFQMGGRADEDPVEFNLDTQLIQEAGGAQRALLPFGREAGLVDQPHAWQHVQRAGPADREQPTDTRALDPVNDRLRSKSFFFEWGFEVFY